MPDIDELLKQIEGEDFEPKLKALATNVHEKLGIDYNEVMKYFQGEVANLETRMPAGTDAKKIHRQAFVRTRGHYKGDLLSDAEHFTGLITGVGDTFDMARRPRAEAREVFEKDPKKAVIEGWTDAEGNPLDRRQNFASGKENRSYGKPLAEHSYIRNLWGVAKREGGELKKFTMPLSEERVDVDIPPMIPVSFRANIKSENDDEFELNQWARISFTAIKSEDPDFENVESIMTDHFQDHLSDCAKLMEYHDQVANDPRRKVLLNIDIDYVAPDVNPVTGNLMVVVSDDSMPDDSPGVTVWIPPHLLPLKGDAGSRAIMGGSTVKNEFQGEDRVMVNAQGIYFDPEYLVEPMPKETKPAQ